MKFIESHDGIIFWSNFLLLFLSPDTQIYKICESQREIMSI